MHYVILSLFLYNVLINESFFTLIASLLFMLGLTFVLSLAPEALLTFSHMYAIDLCKNPQSCWICVQVLSMFKLSRINWVKNFLTPLSSSCMQFVTTILPQERAQQHDFSLPCIEAFWVHVPHLIVLNLFKKNNSLLYWIIASGVHVHHFTVLKLLQYMHFTSMYWSFLSTCTSFHIIETSWLHSHHFTVLNLCDYRFLTSLNPLQTKFAHAQNVLVAKLIVLNLMAIDTFMLRSVSSLKVKSKS